MRDVATIIHFLGLAMGLGASFAFMYIGIASGKMKKNDGERFLTNSFVLSRMAHLGLGLLFLSGGYLATDLWLGIMADTLFLIKIILFIGLGAVWGIISSNSRRAKLADDKSPFLKNIERLGKVSLLLGVAIVVLAVLRFH